MPRFCVQVRVCMCTQLVSLARAVGPELAKGTLLQELLELVNDEEMQVKGSIVCRCVAGSQPQHSQQKMLA